jgi:hypothetical protein
MKIAFNTGRLYTKQGQPMTVTLIENPDYTYSAVFVDHGRGIDGVVPMVRRPDYSYDLARLVMHAYDHGQYRHVRTYDQKDGKYVETAEYQAKEAMRKVDWAETAGAETIEKGWL